MRISYNVRTHSVKIFMLNFWLRIPSYQNTVKISKHSSYIPVHTGTYIFLHRSRRKLSCSSHITHCYFSEYSEKFFYILYTLYTLYTLYLYPIIYILYTLHTIFYASILDTRCTLFLLFLFFRCSTRIFRYSLRILRAQRLQYSRAGTVRRRSW